MKTFSPVGFFRLAKVIFLNFSLAIFFCTSFCNLHFSSRYEERYFNVHALYSPLDVYFDESNKEQIKIYTSRVIHSFEEVDFKFFSG